MSCISENTLFNVKWPCLSNIGGVLFKTPDFWTPRETQGTGLWVQGLDYVYKQGCHKAPVGSSSAEQQAERCSHLSPGCFFPTVGGGSEWRVRVVRPLLSRLAAFNRWHRSARYRRVLSHRQDDPFGIYFKPSTYFR